MFLVIFVFQPETPYYLIKKGDYEEAKKSLAKLRGTGYDVDTELLIIEGVDSYEYSCSKLTYLEIIKDHANCMI